MKTSDEVRSFTVAADDDGIRVDRWFKRHLPQVGFGRSANGRAPARCGSTASG